MAATLKRTLGRNAVKKIGMNFYPRLNKYLQEHPRSAESFIALQRAGCSTSLLHYLFLTYTSPTEAGVQTTERRSGFTRRRRASIKAALIKAAKEIRALNEYCLYQPEPDLNFLKLLRDFGPPGLPNASPEDRCLYARSFEALPYLLHEYANAIKGWPHPAWRSQVARSGKSLELAWAATYVTRITGSPHYRELADYAQAYYAAQGELLDVSPEDIRKSVAHFRKRHPDDVEILQSMTIEELLAPAEQVWAWIKSMRPEKDRS